MGDIKTADQISVFFPSSRDGAHHPDLGHYSSSSVSSVSLLLPLEVFFA